MLDDDIRNAITQGNMEKFF